MQSRLYTKALAITLSLFAIIVAYIFNRIPFTARPILSAVVPASAISTRALRNSFTTMPTRPPVYFMSHGGVSPDAKIHHKTCITLMII